MTAGDKVDLAALGERVNVDQPRLEPTPHLRRPKQQSRPPPTAPTALLGGQRVAAQERPPPDNGSATTNSNERDPLRADQYGQLSDLSRSLNRLRAGNGERITENTLIRVAIDHLLSRETDLAGTTEIKTP